MSIKLLDIIGPRAISDLEDSVEVMVEAGGHLYVQLLKDSPLCAKIGLGVNPHNISSYLLGVMLFNKHTGTGKKHIIDEQRFYFEQYLGSTVTLRSVQTNTTGDSELKWQKADVGVHVDCDRPNFSPLIEAMIEYFNFWNPNI